MAYTQQNIPLRLQLDKSPASLTEDEASYLLNHEVSTPGTLGDTTPVAANYPAAQIDRPAGENYNAGSYKNDITNEEYSWIYNSNGVHYIQRLSADNGLEIIYDKGYVELSADPQHEINQFKCLLRIDDVYDKNGQECKNRAGKQLIWTNGKHPIGCLDVEASIATNGFTTPFFDICPDPAAMVQLAVPEPCGAITASLVPRTLEQIGLSNRILNKGFKFRFRHIYYDLRASEWSDISKPYFLDEKGCFQVADSLPMCWRLRIPIGNPMVEKIEIAFSVGDKSTDGSNDIWFLYATVDKYKKYNSTQEKWYERGLSEEITSSYDSGDCTFEYDFCNNKDCNPIDPKETNRVFNPLPIQPQGILQIKENNFGFYNYRQGNCPVDKTEIEKFSINVDCGADTCKTEYSTVKVRAVIIEVSDSKSNQFVYRLGGVMGGEDDATDTAFYGGVRNNTPAFLADPVKDICGQRFNKARNFTAYIEGTEFFAEMKQWKAYNNFVNPSEYGIISGMQSTDYNTRVVPHNVLSNGFFFQEAIFRVPKGTSGIIRIRSHSSAGNDQSSSAPILGTIPLSSFQSSGFSGTNYDSILTPGVYEIPYDTCNGDQEFNDAFLIPSVDGYNNDEVNYFYNGYITDNNNKPVSGALIYKGSTLKCISDHNGYYSFYDIVGSVAIQVRVEKDCASFVNVKSITLLGVLNGVFTEDIKISDADYADNFKHTLNVSVLDCTGNPIKGITIAITEGKSEVTDPGTGIATFKIRNKYTRDKKVVAYVMDKNGCFSVSCSGECNPCMPKTDLISLGACFINNPTTFISTVDTVNINSVQSSLKNLKRGGRYPFALVIQGGRGESRISAAYALPYIDIPKMQATDSSSGCSLSFNGTGMILPSWAECLKIVRGENINNYELQWVVDKVEKTTDNKIKLTIQSLNDYNENYFFQTNIVYQWLKGDRIEFIRDHEGAIIKASDKGILNYLTISPFHDTNISGRTDADANYFNQLLIEDDGKIDFIKAGAVIEIQRDKVCTSEPVYFQVASIPVENGRLVVETGNFETFDTYTKKRIINGGAIQIFEHHSPSDFWGNRLTDVGKVFFSNIYENEKRFGRNISINAAGQFNYFGDLVKTMPASEQGDIVAMAINDGRVIMGIGENDNFIAEAADDLLRVGTDGVIRALPTDSIIGNPNPKLSGRYGCRYSDVGSIFFGDGFVTWYNHKYYSLIKHDYNFAKAIDFEQAQSYFRTVGTKMDLVNKTVQDLDKIRFISGYNYITGNCILTNKSFRHPGINNDKKLYESPNSTIVFDPKKEYFLTLVSYTAERYSHITLNDGFGCAFLAYLNGVPYIHPVVPEKFNEFFGVPVDRVISVVINKYAEKERVPISMEIQSDMMYFVSNVETSDPGFRSEIPPKKIKGFGKKWNANFLRNINSRGGLFNGKEANDFWIKVTIVRDNTDDLKYGSINNEKRIKFDSLNMILFRFQLSEQSGFTEKK